MPTLTRRGFTFVEILVAMVLMGIISTAIYQLLNNNQRVYREQTVRIELNQNARTAAALFPAELRELNATDPNGSDVVAFTDSSITYNAMRTTYFLCLTPNYAATTIVVRDQPYGVESLNITKHKFMIFAENNAQIRSDDAWLHVDASSATTGTSCPATAGGLTTASITLVLTGVTTAQLNGVYIAAPLRAYQVNRMARYVDGTGAYYLGMQTQNESDLSWSTMQPVVGPLAVGGLALTYFDTLGVATTTAARIARIGVLLTGRSQDPVRLGTGLGYVTAETPAVVSLRNNRRW
jgi:prepilin-type N-terminal cleavage/methylation domain-containing protein